jgi:hypothetical protein
MACEKCWGDAYLRMIINGKGQAENYRELLEERKDNPCTPKEERGDTRYPAAKYVLGHTLYTGE